MFKKTHSIARGKPARRFGVEVVELAIVLPIIFFLTFATLEICEGIFLKQKLEMAAHEGARVAIRKRSTLDDVYDAVKRNLEARGIDYGANIGNAVSVTPDPTVAPTLTPMTVTVTVETNPNLRLSLSLYRYLAGKNIVGEVSMFKEYAN